MVTKIVLNKKNANDDFGILGIQSFKNNSKTKKSLGIRVSVEDYTMSFKLQEVGCSFSILSNGMRCSDVMFMRYGDFM